METIKSYLETMFANMPNTPEVIRAKTELLGMMEDKYNELIQEGKSENEAVGTVISEFGNLDELADTLGINSQPHEAADNRRILSLDEVKSYIHAYSKRSFLIALGVMLCIFSPVFPIIGDLFNITFMEAIMVSLMFVSIAVAVAMFIIAGTSLKRFEDINHNLCMLDYQTSQYVQNSKERMQPIYTICLAVGIMLCIICVVPAIIIDSLNLNIFDNVSGAFLFILCSVGVMLIVFQANAACSYRKLLSLNGSDTISGNYTSDYNKDVQYINPTAATVMSVFWPTVSCIYLSLSFLTFNWAFSWIIWPIAAIIYRILKSFLRK